VININTKATVATGFFLMESPSEGAGSGIVIDKQRSCTHKFSCG
jgi:hypothetical protein